MREAKAGFLVRLVFFVSGVAVALAFERQRLASPTKAVTSRQLVGDPIGAPIAPRAEPSPVRLNAVVTEIREPDAAHVLHGVSFEDLSAGYEVLAAFDRRVLKAVVSQLTQAVHGATTPCGQRAAATRGDAGWPFATRAMLDLDIRNDRVTVKSVSFKTEAGEFSGDDEFRSCFDQRAQNVSLPCPGCKPGTLSIPWAFARFFSGALAPDGGALYP